MADKKESVVTKTTTKTTVTTTTTTSNGEGGWSAMSSVKKLLIILAVILLSALTIILIVFGRAHVKGQGMADLYPENSTAIFNRFATPETGDIVLYRHPEADSIVPSSPDKNYYKSCRLYGKAWCNQTEVVYQNKKRRPICASRVAGVPGDCICISDGVVCKVAGNKLNPLQVAPNAKEIYVVGSSTFFAPSLLDSLNLTKEGMSCDEIDCDQILEFYRHRAPQGSFLSVYALTASQAENLRNHSFISFMEKLSVPKEHFDPIVFPYVEAYHFNTSNMNPMVVPAKGKVLKLDVNNLPIYRRCIEVYEGNTVEVNNGVISINGKDASSYRFERDYYFVVNDNRASTDDSRYFGFIPSNFVVGVVR